MRKRICTLNGLNRFLPPPSENLLYWAVIASVVAREFRQAENPWFPENLVATLKVNYTLQTSSSPKIAL